jgi:RimJ/RimL family protein N-acetyltransferase
MGDLVLNDRRTVRRPDISGCEPASEADLYLRPARPDDAFLLWFWHNDIEARHNAAGAPPTAWSAHEEGYTELLAAAHIRVWMLEFRCVPAAQIRYSRGQGSNADIQLFVLSRFRHRGIGGWLLDATVDLAGAQLGVSRVHATIFADDEACRSTFRRARFSAFEKKLIAGRECLTLQRRCVFDLTDEFIVEL